MSTYSLDALLNLQPALPVLKALVVGWTVAALCALPLTGGRR